MLSFIKSKKFIYPVILVVLFVTIFGAGFFAGRNNIVCRTCKPENIDFSLFWEAYGKLKNNFVDQSKIDNQKIIYGAIEGMAKSLGDPYTTFFNPEEAKRFNDDLSGSFTGIGAEIGIKKDQLTIVAPLEGTPAQKAGLKSGDAVIKINNKNTTDMTTEEAVKLIRGEKGTEVTLTIFRKDWTKTKDIKIIRDTINVPSIKWELKDGDIAHISIYQFDQTLSGSFRKVAMEIFASPAKKIVLDLRNNPGGYLQTAQDLAGWFLEKGQTVTIENFGDKKEPVIYKTEGNSGLLSYPVIILLNQGSASASEILAGALKDNRGVKIVGEKSFGKGSVQTISELSNGSMIKVTIAKWLTPKGNSISEVGIEPDVKIDITENDILQNKDPQLDKALEIIKAMK